MAESSATTFFPRSPSTDAAVDALLKRRWLFAREEHIKAIVIVNSALLDDVENTSLVADAVESELLNMDLRSIGAKSLPESAALRKSSHLHGPKVLQIASARDISKSCIEDVSKSSNNRRLLRLTLTDGHSEITAVEFSHIPSVPNDVVPGTKVRLENKTVVRNGIVCLTPRVLSILGGVVQSLHEEWQMNRKYSAFSRESLQSRQSDTSSPPPFEKLQINAPLTKFPHHERFPQRVTAAPSQSVRHHGGDESSGTSRSRSGQGHGQRNFDVKVSGEDATTSAGKAEEKPNSSETRQKQVAESAPVQNQAAAQKLLQRMNQPGQDNQHNRGRRYRGKGREEETPVFTLEEWERSKSAPKPGPVKELHDITHDEDLEWQLQNLFDLEDAHNHHHHHHHHHRHHNPQESEADRIRRSMFSYDRDNEEDTYGRGRGGRGRGRGRGGRGRGRGRGKGRFS